jgi:hypothetical protein
MKKMYLIMAFAITIFGAKVNAQTVCQPCENIASNVMYNFDNLSNSGPFMTAVKKRLNCYNSQTLCSKTVGDSWDYNISTHDTQADNSNPSNPIPAYDALDSLTIACNAAMNATNQNNTSTSVNKFAQKLREAVQRDVDNTFGAGVKKIKCIIVAGTHNALCIPCTGYVLELKIKFCVDKNDATHQ